MTFFSFSGTRNYPSLAASLIPLIFLLIAFPLVIVVAGSGAVLSAGPILLLAASAIAYGLALGTRTVSRRGAVMGMRRSASQILPAVPILICIALVASSWMLSGVVPTLITFGLNILNPHTFLVVACATCALISVMTGSSWTTIATIGIAFMGIGEAMGFSDPWIAGAIISGAYFGDKVSPLSDTTVVASSTVGVDLFDHIRYMIITTVPAMTVALLIYLIAGWCFTPAPASQTAAMLDALGSTFNITPWTLVIPAITLALIALRIPSIWVMIAASIAGIAGIFILQPQLDLHFAEVARTLWSGISLTTGNRALDDLITSSGVLGMLPTIWLILSAMIFGAAMIGTGMLSRLTDAFTRRMRSRTSIVGATLCSGLSMNCLTGDQYLSLIITGNMYRSLYRSFGLEKRLLSRSMEDSISVTSVLIPWNSCGLAQSAVLGVATLAYAPFCFFNYLTPLFSILITRLGYKIPESPKLRRPATITAPMSQ